MRCGSFDSFFVNFATKSRLDIIMLLKENSLSVGEIAFKLGLEQSMVSHNLKKLMDCSILSVRQEGKLRVYSLNKDTVVPMLELVEKHVKKHCKLGGCNKL